MYKKTIVKPGMALLLASSIFLTGCGSSNSVSDGTEDSDNQVKCIFPNTDPMTLFSFCYDGKDSSEILINWKADSVISKNEKTTVQEITWKDPDTGLCVVMDLTLYNDSKAEEWVVHLKNTGNNNTPIIEDFYIADFKYTIDDPSVSYSKGTNIRDDDFLFVTEPLRPFSNRTFSSDGGRSTSGDYMPYFNVSGEGKGCFFAIGWSGQWEAKFKCSSDGVRIVAGMEKTHFFLYPGESVLTPSFTRLVWEGNETESYNLWRSHMIAAHTPLDENGDVITLPITCGAWGGDSTQRHLTTLQYISNCKYDYDAYWIDAGWFGDESRHSSDQYGDEWFKNAGNWYHNTTLYPNGLLPISKAAHENDMDFLLWFEPERAWWDSQIVSEHPEWFLTTDEKENISYLFNMGNEEACQWMTNFISSKIQEYGVDIYRQDFNTAPLPYWEAADDSSRIGITEMKYIEGLYKYLSGLLEKNPGLIIDNCAGGGRRLDYEILNYSLPMFRSDYQCFDTYKTTSCQVQTDGLSHWVPLNGTCTQLRVGDTYSFRSNLAYAVQTPATDNISWQKQMLEDFHLAQPYFTGDYYRVSSGDVQSDSEWYAYQMHDDETDSGFIAAFRRQESASETENLSIYVPDGVSNIKITDRDTGEVQNISTIGVKNNSLQLPVTIGNVLESKLLFYEMK